MNPIEINQPESLEAALIAACGMNCGICIGHLRKKKRCPGCNGDEELKPHHCTGCRIKNCPELTERGGKYCFECTKFPCARLRSLDQRYQANYGMSMIANLETIRATGIDDFVAREQNRWTCPTCGALLCVHRKECLACGRR